MHIFPRPLCLIALCVLAAGCAARPAFDISTAGRMPPRATFALAPADQAQPTFSHLAAKRLKELGFQPNDSGEFTLQIALARRPAGAGLFLPAHPDFWLRAPARSGSAVRPTLVLTLSERSTGREVYRIAVASRRAAVPGPALLAAALDQMNGPVMPKARVAPAR
jgi:hypothetical protein